MSDILKMTYRNWRGEVAERRIRPDMLWFGVTKYHTTPGWMLLAFDMDKEEHRDFALADCQFADLVPAPAVPDDVAMPALLASHVEWLRGDHEGCNPWLADMIEAQAAELARKNAALRQLSTAACFGNGEVAGDDLSKSAMGREVLARMAFSEAAITQPALDGVIEAAKVLLADEAAIARAAFGMGRSEGPGLPDLFRDGLAALTHPTGV